MAFDDKIMLPYYWNTLFTFYSAAMVTLMLGRFISYGKDSNTYKQKLVRILTDKKVVWIVLTPLWTGILWLALYIMEIASGYLVWSLQVTSRTDTITGDITIVDSDGTYLNRNAFWITLSLSFWIGQLFFTTFYWPMLCVTQNRGFGMFLLIIGLSCSIVKDVFMWMVDWRTGLVGLFFPVYLCIITLNLWSSCKEPVTRY